MDVLDNKIRKLIKDNLRKRIAGHGDIDNIVPNEELIEQWMTAITFIAICNNDLEAAANSLNDIQSAIRPISIEDSRAFLFLVSQRFCEEIFAFSTYLKIREEKNESFVLHEVQKELEGIENGDFMFN